MADGARPSGHQRAEEVEDLAEEVSDIARALSDLISMATALGRAGNRAAHTLTRHREGHGNRSRSGGERGDATQSDSTDRASLWHLRILNTRPDAVRFSLFVPDAPAGPTVFGWYSVMPGWEGIYPIEANSLGQLGLMACTADDVQDVFAHEVRRVPVVVPLAGAIPETMRFVLGGWDGATEPSVCTVHGPASRLVDVGCVTRRADATGTIAFEIPRCPQARDA